MEIRRVFDMLEHQLNSYPKEDALAAKVNGQWVKHSTRDFYEQAHAVARGLLAQGIAPGDRVAIASVNRPEWVICDYGCQLIGAVGVPIYPTITPEDYAYILEDSGARMAFVGSAELLEKVQASPVGQGLPVYSFDALPNCPNWSELKESGNAIAQEQVQALKDAVKPDDLFTLIYTSGTTGRPKGVMLTHGNLITNIESSKPAMPVDHSARALSFLPLSHVYERMVMGIYVRFGVSVYFAESMETIGDNLKEVKPHLFTTVPRLLEKVYDKIVAKGRELTGIKRNLFFWALDLGLRYDIGKPRSAWYNLQLKLANKIIFSKWREALGGNVVCIVSGSAALQPRLARVFRSAGIAVMEGYGLTETSPVISVNRIEETGCRVGSVGLIIENVEVKIAEDGEILTKGPCLFKGYYNRPDLTAEVIDSEGWFHTGDIGVITEGRFLNITDRKKEIFKTSGGKYIAPQQLENKLKESMVIEQAMVVGEGQKFPGALVVPDFAALRTWCGIKGLAYSTDGEMIKHPMVLDKFQAEIDKLNDGLAQFERIKKFELMPRLWTIADGEITPTLKPKRKIIMQKAAGLVERIYAG